MSRGDVIFGKSAILTFKQLEPIVVNIRLHTGTKLKETKLK